MHQNWLLSGGIGSGKSSVRRALEAHGVTTIDADSVGHEVLAVGGEATDDIADAWPSVVVKGVIDRSRLGKIAFSDSEALHRLESITHPYIFRRISQRVEQLDVPVVVEVPLLIQPFESPWRRIVVDADDETRLDRAVARGLDEGNVRKRMAAQPTRGEWLAAADLVIPNHGTLEDLDLATSQIVPLITGGVPGPGPN